MADKRINALATTASSTASDDFIAVDGTTNGTRKLNAFSPTFGGNATVTGTLTVNGANGISIGADTTLFRYDAQQLRFSSASSYAIFQIRGTTGSYVDFYASNGTTRNGSIGTEQAGTMYLGTRVAASTILISNGSDALTIDSSQNATFAGRATVNSTTASTSTSSGALVVSGGVGVAGSQYLGVKLNISTHTGDAGGIGFGTETNLYRYQAGGLALDHASGAAPGLLFRENGSSTLRLETNSGVGYLSTLTSANLILRTNATTALTLDTSQNATFAGTIRTAAPVGGTAASWKLGTVATVSPTSPNRTIEVDIGGTIYYIHAKTTNN